MDRRSVVQVGVTVGVADCDVVDVTVVAAVGRQDRRAREPVDGRDHRNGHQTGPRERQEVEVVVDQIEASCGGEFEAGGDMQRLVDLDVVAVVDLVTVRDHADQLGAGG